MTILYTSTSLQMAVHGSQGGSVQGLYGTLLALLTPLHGLQKCLEIQAVYTGPI